MFLSRLSIRQQLFLIVAIVALPALGIIVYSGVQQRATAVRAAEAETQKLAESIVSEQRNLVAATRQLFIALAQLPEITERRERETQAILAEILRQSPQYSNLFITDPAGNVWVSAVPLRGAIAVADRRYFRNALASGRLSSGEYHIARTSGKPTLNLGYPLKDATGRVTAVLCAGLSLDYHRQIFNLYQLPQGASFALLDHRGIVLSRAVDPEKYMGKPADPTIFRQMLDGPDEQTSIGRSSVTGDERVQTYRKLRLEGESTPYMYVRTGIPTVTVMAAANAALARNLLIYLATLAAAFLLAWFLGRKCIIDRVLLLQSSSQRLADGDLNVRVAAAVDGGELGELGKTFDEMAQKLAARERALRESESNYREIFNATHDALFVTDQQGVVVEANRSAEAMFGYAPTEFPGMSIQVLMAGTPPYSMAEALPRMERVFSEGMQHFEWLSRKKNGTTFWTELAITPLQIGGAWRILAVVRDISERKEMEQVKETMLSNISHEMRTPLTAMLGFLEFVIENRVDAEQLKDYHIIMRKEGERLNEMVTNYLDMQRLKAKLHAYDFQPLDVRGLIEDVVAIYASPSARHAITVGPCAALPRIVGDDELLHQALGNLISNALKYSPEGSAIIVDARQDGAEVILSVQDAGIGIAAEYVERIFDIFYRVATATAKQPIAGTGLGLALVKEIALIHGGRVWVESRDGAGSTFFIALPIAGPLSV